MIQGISRRFLDPRRPTGPLSNSDKEEMLIPYHAVLPINPLEVASYYKRVVGVSQIQSLPSLFESTSIILASGIDLFVTRRMPSKTFDRLSENFSYYQLVASILALAFGVWFSNRAVEQKRVAEAWQ